MAGTFLLLGACASDPKEEIGSMPPPGVHFGNEIVLLDSATEKVVSRMTPDGRVHLIAITAGNDAYHVVVSAQGVERRERIGDRRYGYYQNLAIADDAQGRLHVALKDEHWILDKGAWRLAGTQACALLARAGDALGCVTHVNGSELGTQAQWGASLIGGLGAGIIIPYRIRPSKLVLAQAVGDGWSYRSVLDHHLPYLVNLETYDSGTLAGDATGTFHLLFRAHEGKFSHVRYDTLTLEANAQADIEWRRPDEPAIPLGSVESAPVWPGANWFVPFDMLALAVDPQTGKALFFARRSESGFGNWTDAVVPVRGEAVGQPVALPLKRGKPKKLAPAGDEGFHALVAVDRNLLYLSYRDDRWSGPVKIGEFGTPSLFLIDNSSIQLASDGRRQALAIWPRKEG
ncbi:MAG TPA: hypothetical protein VFX83_11535, partial [Azonexus sp.]|nr:hypothetical protein [Azonexus sp.]